jgi:hypothetical protein
MEDRTLLATMLWANAASGDWDVNANWVNQSNSSDHHVPTSSDDAQVNFSGITVTHSSSASDSINSVTVAGGTNLSLSSGALAITAALTISGNLTMSGGTLSPAATLTVSGAMTWTGGTINGGGTLTTQGTLALGSASASDTETLSGATLDNAGSATLSAANFAYGLILNNGAVFDNQSGSSFTLQTDATISSNGVSSPTFKNEGTLTKAEGTGNSPVGCIFNQTGTGSLQVQSGTLQPLNAGGSIAGSVSVASGAVLNFNNAGTYNLTASSTLSGAGIIGVTGAAVNEAGSYNVTGTTSVYSGSANLSGAISSLGTTVIVAGGTLNLATGQSLSISTLTISAGTLSVTSPAALTVGTQATWTGGTINGGGTLTTQGTLTLGSASASDIETLNGATLDNAGSATLAVQNGQTNYGLYLYNGALFDNQPSGSFAFQTDAGIVSNGVSSPTFKNEGTLTKAAGTAASAIGSIFNQTGTGSLLARSGTLQLTGGETFAGTVQATSGGSLTMTALTNLSGGTLTGATWIVGANSSMSLGGNITTDAAATVLGGSGASFSGLSQLSRISAGGSLQILGGGALSVAGSLDNSGIITLSPGTLTVPGAYTQEASGSLAVGVGGLTAGSQFGELNATGQVALNGALNVSLLNNYSPPSGDSYRILTFGSRTGDFAVESGLYLGGGEGFAPTYDSSGLSLVVIPEQLATTTGLASGQNPSVYGQAVTFTATVAPTGSTGFTPSGTVTFYDGGTNLGTSPLSGGTASLRTTSLVAGSHAIVAAYNGDVNFSGSNSSTLNQTVKQDATTTVVTTSLNPSTFGQSVTFTATVTASPAGGGTPTGTVTFYDGSTSLGTATLSSGTAVFTTSALFAGSHSISASYGGDTNFSGSTAAAVTQTVNQDGSTATVSNSSVNPSVFGQSVTLGATVSAAAPGSGTPTGIVTFYDGSTILGTAGLSSGSASYTTSSLTVGTHSITASYGGNTNFTGSSSTTFAQTVNQDASATIVTSSLNPSIINQSVTFTATVSAVAPGSGTPTGTVIFYDGATAIDTETLGNGSAAFTTSSLGLGDHSITVQYGGDTDFTSTTSPAIAQTVKQASSTSVVTSSVNPSVFGQSVTFTATVSATPPGTGTPTGTVTFYDGSTAIDTETLVNGSASYASSALAVGSHAITVQYNGDSDFNGSTSTALSQVVNQDGSATALSSSLNPSIVNQSVTFTAVVTASSPGSGTPTGSVTFYNGSTAIDTATLSGGSASFTTSALTVGNHSITAVYGGNTNFTGSSSSTLAQTANQDASATIVTSSLNPSIINQSITFTATVSAAAPGSGTPTGTVTFYDGPTSVDTETLSNGSAAFTTSSLGLGSHSITVQYGGDAEFTSSTSAAISQTIKQASSTSVVTSSVNPSVYGQSVTFTATVSASPPASGTPTGTVTFYDGSTAIDSETLVNGSASYGTSALAVGSHAITVQYNGDSDFNGSTSTALSQVVNQDGSATALSSSLNPSIVNQSVTFTATVSASSPGSGTPTGSVTFYDGSAAIDTEALSGGSASFTTSALPAGDHSISAAYGGNANFTGSSSPIFAQVVNEYPDLTVFAISGPAQGVPGQQADISYTVANTGTADASGTWTDRIFLSASSTGTNAQLIASYSYNATIPAGQSLPRTKTVTLPAAAGSQWIVVETNAGGSIFEANTANNTGVSAQPIAFPPNLVVSLDRHTVSETGTNPVASATITRETTDTSADLTVTLTTSDTTAISAPATVTIPAGQTSATIGLSAVNDTLAGGNRPVTISASATGFYSGSDTLSFLDDDLPTLTAALAANTIAENAGAAATTITVTRNTPADSPLSVFLSSSDTTAAAVSTTPVVIPAGYASASFPVDAVDDQYVGATKTATISASAPGFVGGSDVLNVTETDQPALSPVITAHKVAENAGASATTVTVTRNTDTSSDLVVNVVSSNMAAATVPATVTIPAGQTSATFPISAIDDGKVNGDQTATITASAAGLTSGSDSLTIAESDQLALAVALAATTVPESAGASATTGTVSVNAPRAADLVVTLASDNINKATVPAAVTIPAGQTSATFTVATVDDGTIDGDQDAKITASAAGYVGGSELLTVTDSDMPVLTLSLSSATVLKNAQNPAATGTITRSIVTSQDLIVALDSSDGSKLTVPSPVTIPAGQASVTFPVGVVNDQLVDGTQTVTLTAALVDSSFYQPISQTATTATISIIDTNSPTLNLTLAQDTISEGAGASATTGSVSINAPAPSDLVVTLASADTGLLTVPATATIPAGQTSATFPVSTSNNPNATGITAVAITASAVGYNDGVGQAYVAGSETSVPDLKVTGLSIPSTGYSGQSLTVTWQVTNQGLSAAAGPWVDDVYLSTDAQSTSGTLLTSFTYNDSLAVGSSYQQTAAITLPTDPGTYWIVVTTNATGTVSEGTMTNNTAISAQPVQVSPAYAATVSAGVKIAPIGTPIPLSGQAVSAVTGLPDPNVPVLIRILTGGIRRTISVTTDADGQFSATFQPLPTEAGVYTIGAADPNVIADPAQDQFTLVGMSVALNPSSTQVASRVSLPNLRVFPGIPLTAQATLNDLGTTPLTGITATVSGAPGNLSVQVSPPSTLPGSGSAPLQFTLQASDDSVRQGTVTIHLTSAEGASADLAFNATIAPQTATLVANPGYLDAGMVRGSQRMISFSLSNVGGSPTGDIQVGLPGQATWLSLVSPATISSMAPGATVTLTLLLTPSADLPLGLYNGAIALVGSAAQLSVPLQVKCVSDAVGDVQVSVVDEYTYFAEGAPKVSGAEVTLTDPSDGTVVARGVADSTGTVLLTNVPEGTYNMQVQASGHSAVRGPYTVLAGQTNQTEIFLHRQLVTYDWAVVPTEVQDEYQLTLESNFQTDVPLPLVTVDKPFIVPLLVGEEQTQVDLTFTNQGLIAAHNVQITGVDNPYFTITPLISSIPVLPAKSSMVVPVIFQAKPSVFASASAPSSLGATSLLDYAQKLISHGGSPSEQLGAQGLLDFFCHPDAYIHFTWENICGVWTIVLGGSAQVSPAITEKTCASNFFKNLLSDLPGALGSAALKAYFQNLLKMIEENDILEGAELLDIFKDKLKDLSCEKAVAFLECLVVGPKNSESCYAKALASALCGALFKGIKGAEGGSAGVARGVAAGAAGGILKGLKCLICSLSGTGEDGSDPLTLPPSTSPSDGGPPSTFYFYDGFGKAGSLFQISETDCSSTSSSTAAEAPGSGPGVSTAGSPNPTDPSQQSICAQVRIRIQQRAVVTRDAFQGTLEIDNGHTDIPLSGISVSLDIRDENDNPAGNFFLIKGPVLDGLSAIDGTGVIAPGGSGTADYTFIPTIDAAANGPTQYTIGGTLHYTDDGQDITVPLLPSTITVLPQASLRVNYFLQKDVYSDDPFTPQVEPAQPFSLGLMVTNVGQGTAQNLSITSAQPQIVENQKGLLINFKMIGTQIGTQQVTPSLTVNLGDIAPGQTQVAQFIMTASLQGEFTSYKATFEHTDDLNDPRTSLIQSVNIHEMNHVVRVDVPSDDGMPDFLVNDIPDPQNLPDTLYNSDGSVEPVTAITTASVDGSIGYGNLQVHVTAAAPSGYIYIQIPDPAGNGPFHLAEVVRSDGKIIRLDDNAWTTHRTLHPTDAPAYREDLFHLFDLNDTGSTTVAYTLVYAKDDPIPPQIAGLDAVSPDPRGTAVSTLEVNFTKTIDPSSLTYHALTLTLNGGPNLITSAVTITPVDGSNNTNFQIAGLDGLTAADGTYTLTVDASNVVDLSYNNGAGSASDTWVVDTVHPLLDATKVSPSPRNAPVSSLEVGFDRPIDLDTFDYHALSLTLNGGPNLITNAVTIEAEPGTASGYLIDGLGALTQAEGSYTLTVDASGVKDTNGVSGVGTESTTWVMDTTAPSLVSLDQVTTNPRNIVVPSLDVTFSEPIDLTNFVNQALTLTRLGSGPGGDGQTNLINNLVTVAAVPGTTATYEISGFNWVSGYEGTYTLTVNAAGITDPAGNAGVGSASASWVMDTTPPAKPTNLAITPDTGVSSTDGLTNASSVTLTGQISSEANQSVYLIDTTTGEDLGVATVTGTTFAAALNFAVAGEHKIKVNAVDLAGNVSDDAVFDLFIDQTPPVLTGLASITPNPRTTAVSSESVTFNKPINLATLNANDVSLSLNGGSNLITGAVTFTLVSGTTSTYQIGGLDALTADLGTYTLAVDMSQVQDRAGNVGSGISSVSWTMVSGLIIDTTTTVQSSEDPSKFGDSVTFTATVSPAQRSGTPTGSVQFSIDGSPFGAPLALQNGIATLTTSSLAVGGHTVSALYTSDTGQFNPSAGSLSGNQTVTTADTTSAVTTSSSSSTYGQSLVFTATVAPVTSGLPTPTGTLQFEIDGSVFGTALALVNGSATSDAVDSLSAGAHTITVVYSGDPNFATSTSANLTQTVNPAPLAVTANDATKVYGEPNPGFTAGYNGFVLGQDPSVLSGTLAFSTPASAASHAQAGGYPITPSGLTSSNYAITFVNGTLTITPAPLTITADDQSMVYGAPLPNLTASYAGFVNGDTPASLTTPVTLSTSATSSSPVGTYTIQASGATSTDYQIAFVNGTLTIDQAGTTTSLVSSANPSVYGQSVTVTATISAVPPGGGTPTGSVTFYDNGVSLGTGTLTGGAASFSASSLSVATHSITAIYGGDNNFTASTSGAVSQAVNQDSTSAVLSSSVNPSVYGQSVTFTATVSVSSPGAGTPTGTVTFNDGTTTLGTGTLDGSGVATFTTSALSVAGHSITAAYGGDTNDQGSTSTALGQTVNRDSTSTVLTSTVNPSVFGQSVTFTAAVSVVSPGTGTPTGTVTFKDGSNTLGTGTLNGSGMATLATSSLSVSTHSITAVYGGDTNDQGSTSGAVSQMVNQDSTATSLYSSANPSVFGQSVTFTATVSANAPGSGTPSGMVTFKDGTTVMGAGTLSGGAATFTTSALAVGSHPITAVYAGDGNFVASTSAPTSQAVNQDGTSTSLTSSANPSVSGQSVTFTATVTANAPGSGTPTGTVTFKDGATLLGTSPLSGGVASITMSSLSVASHNISVAYGGDTNFTGSSTVLSQTVNQDSTSTTLSPSVNPSVYGQSVTFAAVVTAAAPGSGTPTGNVTFLDGTTTLATVALSGGSATLTMTSLSAATHSITAAYGGDGNFTTSTSTALSQVVNKAGTTTGLTSSVNPSVFGQSVTFTATVGVVSPGAGTPTGTVKFEDGTSTLGTGTLTGGMATFTTTSLSVATHSITAVYSGDGNFGTSTSTVLSQVVNKVNTTTGLTSSVSPSVYGQSVTFTATVTSVRPGAGSPTGTVTFTDGSNTLGTGTLNGSGIATLRTSALSVASHSVTALYGGDANDLTSTSSGLSQVVNKDTTTTALSSSVNPSVYGQSVIFTATVSAVSPGAGTPSGSVTFIDGTTTLGTGTLSGGAASFSTSSLSVATHSITAVYVGDTNDQGSTSATLTQTVNKDATSTALVSSANPSVHGQSVTSTATVTASAPGSGTPTGSVTFKDGTTTLGTGTLSGGVATFTTSSLSVATHSITAVYGGDGNFTTSTSSALSQVVNKDSTSTSLTSSVNPSTFGQSVTFTATGTANAPGSGTPTGTVTFKDGTTTLGTGTLSGGVATFTTSKLSVGTHSITATYSGDANFKTSTSPVVTQTVNKKKALVVAGGPVSGVSNSVTLTQAELAPIVKEAMVLWWEAGIDPQRLAAISQVHVQIEDLPGPDLGLASPGLIEIDDNAAGYGWYIDSTPNSDSLLGPGIVNSPARDHVDLLSVVCHEMGHELGFEHDDGNDVMAESLAPGVRHVPIAVRAAGDATGPLLAVSVRRERFGSSMGAIPIRQLGRSSR